MKRKENFIKQSQQFATCLGKEKKKKESKINDIDKEEER